MASAAASLSKGGGNDRFNAEAAAWDNNPFVHEMSKEAWTAIQDLVPTVTSSSQPPDVLEIGCGTGLLSFLVAQKARRVVAVDAAQGMIDVLKQKLTKPDAPTNIVPVCVLLEDPEDALLPPADDASENGTPRMKFDLITSHLVLHHIPDLKPVLTTMLHCLKPGTGMVALTDFEDFGPEAKRFHPQSKMAGVERHGINREWMEGLMKEVGFVDVSVKIGWRSLKRVEKFSGEFGSRGRANKEQGEGEDMEFSYVVCLGRRP